MQPPHLIVLVSSFFIIATSTVYGQEAKNSDLAKKTQNPISDLISLPFQNNTNFGIGPDDKTQNIQRTLKKIINSGDYIEKVIYKNMLRVLIKRARDYDKELDLYF
jgi:hypothetical protein